MPDDHSAVVAVRAVLDPAAIPYLQSELARIGTMPATSAKVREAAALLRRLRGAWIAIGTQAKGGVADAKAQQMLQRWRTLPATDEHGDATSVLLLVQSRMSHVLDGTAWSVDDARAQLEALSSVFIDDIVAVELVGDGLIVQTRELLEQLHDPPMHEVLPHGHYAQGVPFEELTAA